MLNDISLKSKIKIFHQVFTDEVYGDLPLNQPKFVFTEETPKHKSSTNFASKISADLLV